jgi:hypothetical protein
VLFSASDVCFLNRIIKRLLPRFDPRRVILHYDLFRVPEKYRNGARRNASLLQFDRECVSESMWMRILNLSILKNLLQAIGSP